MKTIALVPCSSGKVQTTRPLPAKDFYIGTFFHKALECAKSLQPDEIYILSAKHHVVELEQKMTYYNMLLSKQPVKYRKMWAEEVLYQLEEKGVNLMKDEIIFLTGKAYYENIQKHIVHNKIVGEGLRIGLKMQEFNRIIQFKNKK